MTEQPLIEVVGKLTGRSVPLLRIPGDGAPANTIQCDGNRWVERPNRRGWSLVFGMKGSLITLLRRSARAGRGIGPMPAKTLEEDNPQAEDIAPLIDLSAEAKGLFRAHIRWRSYHRTVASQAGINVRSPGQTEIDQPGTAEVIDEHVGWFDVSVQDTLMMGMVDRISQVAQDSSGRWRIQTVMVAIPPERPPADEMESDPAPSIIETGIMNGNDVGMIQPRRGPGLSEEPLHDPLVGIGLLEHLECDVPIEPGIKREKDLPEAAIPQSFAELKPSQRPQRPPAPCLGPVGCLLRVRRAR
jgi:hypothetical protein